MENISVFARVRSVPVSYTHLDVYKRQVKERPPEGTRRVLLTVSYDGTAYAGWQWQDNALSVQQVLEEALAHLTGEKTRVTGASRTDAGVHALGQRAHFDTASRIPPDKYPFALNTLLRCV